MSEWIEATSAFREHFRAIVSCRRFAAADNHDIGRTSARLLKQSHGMIMHRLPSRTQPRFTFTRWCAVVAWFFCVIYTTLHADERPTEQGSPQVSAEFHEGNSLVNLGRLDFVSASERLGIDPLGLGTLAAAPADVVACVPGKSANRCSVSSRYATLLALGVALRL